MLRYNALKRIAFVLSIVIFVPVLSFADVFISLTNETDIRSTGKSSFLFTEEKNSELTFENISSLDSKEFTMGNETNINFGYTSDAHWIRFTVKNDSDFSTWVLLIPYPLIDEIKIYIADGKKLLTE